MLFIFINFISLTFVKLIKILIVMKL